MGTPDSTPVDNDILRLVQEALDLCTRMPAQPTPGQVGTARGRADYALQRLQLWLRDCVEQPA